MNRLFIWQSTWALRGGILTASLVTLLGVVCRHEPETILFRTVAGALFISLLMAVMQNVLEFLLEDDDEL